MSHLSRIRKGLVLTFALSLSAAASGSFPDEPAIRNWSAPPFWSNVVPQPEGTEASGREALASGRQALVPGPVALPFVALAPCRLVDTRGNGAPLTGGFLPPATVRGYQLTGVCGIPASAQAVSLNATVVRPTGPGFLTLWPQGGAYPPVSTLNYVGNDIVANAAVVPLGTLGAISMALGVSGGDVILDTNGYYAPAGVSSVNALTGDVTLAAGSNLTLNTVGNALTLATSPTITANLTGNVTGSATSFTGPLAGNVTGTQGATVVSSVGGQSAANVAAATVLANSATTASTPNTIVKRDALGHVTANVVTADGGYHQPGTGGETLRMVRGIVYANGSIGGGTGFTIVHPSTGTYTVNFTTSFSGMPTVLITPAWGRVLIPSWSPSSVNLSMEPLVDTFFFFVAIGPP